VAGVAQRLDLNELAHAPAERLAMNDIGRVTFKLAQPIFPDPYEENRATGAFIVIDEATHFTVGAGLISS
jgi:sulfate adenylyltransferase subunit 1